MTTSPDDLYPQGVIGQAIEDALRAIQGPGTTGEPAPRTVTIWSDSRPVDPNAAVGFIPMKPRQLTYDTSKPYEDQIKAFWDDPTLLSQQERDYVKNASIAIYGYDPGPQGYRGTWVSAFKSADYSGQNIFSVLGQLASEAKGEDGPGGGGGTTTAYDFTDPRTARALIDTSLKAYLGRAATEDEISKFAAALRAEEQANPTVVTSSGGVQTRTGGMDAQLFARDYAAQQEGYAEYQVATKYLDLFLGALD
jgi:hypothetical protein